MRLGMENDSTGKRRDLNLISRIFALLREVRGTIESWHAGGNENFFNVN